MKKYAIGAMLILADAVVVQCDRPGEFNIRETKGDQPGPQRVLEIEGHGKKCYIYNSTPAESNSSVLLWCEDQKQVKP